MKKTFRSTTSAVKITLACMTMAVLLAACSPNARYQGKGETTLQGEWKQDSVRLQQKLITYSLYNFKFNCDSFFVSINTVSKVNYGADTCMNKGHWTEYARGLYVMSHDTLRIRGFFTYPNQKIKYQADCFRVGVIDERFKVKQLSDSLYQFRNLTSTEPFTMHLTKKITCVPKPL
ncbi:fumarate hydratase [Mucilaginibacter sp. RS28]|uniref:Fumarate hydratase n=1 Tax=Mucilaginibacter straminoryzae TaxID=2932774 RepID=A0A9X1WZF5_9SPHI|nr:fumarate hydratase [Mucilaginibacter straminoryzae]MCJ8208253.1 fumarate hydratase [Mucilaginibacter straminoryzae]